MWANVEITKMTAKYVRMCDKVEWKVSVDGKSYDLDSWSRLNAA